MRRFVVGLFAVIGLVVVLAVIATGVVVWRIAVHEPTLPQTIVLQADLNRGLSDGPSGDALSNLVLGGKPTLRDFLDTLERAGDDKRVKGILVSLGNDNIALATCQEVRDAVHALRAKGKFAIAFAASFGEFGPGSRPYYLAASFDEVWLQPLGSVGLIGLQSETPFFRGTLDRLGITPSFAHREQYKTAMNSLTETAMTPPQREEVEDLLGVAAKQLAAGIAADRKLAEERVAALIDRGPFVADEARSFGLVDHVGYVDEAGDEARRRAGPDAEFVTAKRYLDIAGRPHDKGAKVALIYATGLIAQGSSSASPLLGNEELSARKVARALRQAAHDQDVRAILFRIDSPGGSAVASETIWREVVRAREQGKPVIASMGDLAGSGGYYIAAPADRIVAEPATLTGSIGVLAGKLVVAGLLDKLGVTHEAVQRGANAAMYSEFDDFSPTGRQRLDAFLDAFYAGFKDRVASGRHLTAEQVEAVAKGRVWTGEEAQKNGLVDALGGYDVALRLAREAAKLTADEPVKLAVFPRRKSAIERLYDRLANREEESDSSLPLAAQRLLPPLQSMLSAAEAALRNPGILLMPAIGDIR